MKTWYDIFVPFLFVALFCIAVYFFCTRLYRYQLYTNTLADELELDDEPEIWFPTHKRKKASHGKGNRNKSKKRRKAHAKNH